MFRHDNRWKFYSSAYLYLIDLLIKNDLIISIAYSYLAITYTNTQTEVW